MFRKTRISRYFRHEKKQQPRCINNVRNLLTDDMSKMLPGKNGASTAPNIVLVANRSLNVFVAAWAAETIPQIVITMPRNRLGRARVSKRFDGIWKTRYPYFE